MNTKDNNVRYNYYNIECVNIVNNINNNMQRRITASFRGKENNPNIIYTKGNLNLHYQATNIFITGKNHIMSDKYDGEIVILHKPTTSSINLYSCFPYVKSESIDKDMVIDDLISSSSNSLSDLYQQFPVSIEINKFVKTSPSVYEYKTIDNNGENCIVLYFDNVIKIRSNLNSENIELTPFMKQTTKPDNYVLERKLKSPSILLEGFHEALSVPNVNELPSVNDAVKKMDVNTVVNDFTKSLLEKVKDEKVSDPTTVSIPKKDNSDVIYKCEYLPVDTDEMVQVLQVPIGTPGYHYGVGALLSGIFVSATIFIFSILLIFFIAPILYGIIESLVISKTFLDNVIFIKTHTNLNISLLDLIIALSMIGTAIGLLTYGLMTFNTVAIAVALFIPFFMIVSYIGIVFFRNSRGTLVPL